MIEELFNVLGALPGAIGNSRQEKEANERSRRRYCREKGLCPECESRITAKGDKCKSCRSELPICRGIWRPTRRELTWITPIGYIVLIAGGIGMFLVLVIPQWRASIFGGDGSGLAPVLLIGFGALAAAQDHIHAQERIDKRIDERLCPRCGYDVRKTRDRCPECGTKLSANGPNNGMAM